MRHLIMFVMARVNVRPKVPLGSPWDETAIIPPQIFLQPRKLQLSRSRRRGLHQKIRGQKRTKKTNKQKPSNTANQPFYRDQTFSEAATFKRDAMICLPPDAASGDMGRSLGGTQDWYHHQYQWCTKLIDPIKGNVIYLPRLGVTQATHHIFLIWFATLNLNQVQHFERDISHVIACQSNMTKRVLSHVAFINQCIEPNVQWKDADYGSWHIRHIWSRNLKDIQELKSDFRSTVGLSKRSGCHKDPHENLKLNSIAFKLALTPHKHHEDMERFKVYLQQPWRASASAL